MQSLDQAIGGGLAVGANFRFRGIRLHATFPGHIDFDQLCKKVIDVGGGRASDVKRLSIVHELGGEDEPNMADDDFRRYEHTHVAVEWTRERDRRCCRFMDIEVDGENIHPNITHNKSMPWFKGLFYNYHQGRKVGKDGKVKVTPPVKLKQWGVAGWEHDRETMDRAAAAPTLIDACLVAGVSPKSVGDVAALRAAVKKRSCETALEGCDEPWRDAPDEWNPNLQSLIVVGATGTGKTNWAKAQFEHACVIRQLDCLKAVPDHATGLVFDDQEYAALSIQDQKMIFDCREACFVKARYANAEKPKLPAIFTCNDLSRLCNLDADGGAIATRTYVWNTGDEKMYG